MFWWCIASSMLSVALSVAALLLALRRERLPSKLRTLALQVRGEMADVQMSLESLMESHRKLRNREEMAARRAASRVAAADALSAPRSGTSDVPPAAFNGTESKSAWRKKRGVPENPMDWPKWNLAQQGRKP